MHIRPNRLRSAGVLGLVIAMVLVAFLVTPPRVRADHDAIPWANPNAIATSGLSEQGSTVLTDGKGHVYFFYSVSNGFQFSNISMTEYTTYGPFGFPMFVMTRQVTSDPTSARTNNPSYPPAAAIDHNGYLYVAWVKQAAYTGGRSDDLYVSRSTDGGNTWVPTLASAPNGVGADVWPSIAASSTGRIWIAYAQAWSGWNNITVAYSDTAGSSFGGYTNITVPAGRFYQVTTPTVATDASGRAYVAYSQQAITAYYLVYLAWSNTGVVWTTQRISTFLQTFAYYPSVAPDASGKVHIAWWDNRFASYGGTSIYYRQSPDGGATWLPEVLLSSDRGLATNGRVSARLLGQNLVVLYQSFLGGALQLGQAISPDDGSLWYPGTTKPFERQSYDFGAAMDENGTVWLGLTQAPFGNNDVMMSWWNGPPSPPTITNIARATGQLTVSWSTPPEADVVAYQVWRSMDGSTYQVVASTSVPTTSWTDTGLANGTYWYRVTALDNFGTSSHGSGAVSGTVGPTTAELVAALEAQITDLENQLATAQADITAIQAQLDTLQTDLNNLQSSTNANYAELQSRLDKLQSRLDQIETENATQTQSYLNTILIIVVIVLLVFMLMQSRRMTSMRTQMIPRSLRQRPPQQSPPMGAPTEPPGPGQPRSDLPDDDL